MAPHDITAAAATSLPSVADDTSILSDTATTSLLPATALMAPHDITAAATLPSVTDATSLISSVADDTSILSDTATTSLLPATALMATHDITAAAATCLPSVTDATSLLSSAADDTSRLSDTATTMKRAYVTYLASNIGDRFKGVVGLVKGLRKVKSKHPLVVLVSPELRREYRQILVSQGCLVREVKPIHRPENQTQYAMASNGFNYSQILIWTLVEFTKMVYLDADILVLKNIDHLFDFPDDDIFATWACSCAMENTWSHSPQYCQHSPDKVRWDPILGSPPVDFDAGMFVFEPSSDIFHGLLALLITLKNTTPSVGFKDLLNMFFKQTYLPLPYEYNFNIAMLLHHPEHKLDMVKVVRYCPIESKPWRYIGEEQQKINRGGTTLYHEGVPTPPPPPPPPLI